MASSRVLLHLVTPFLLVVSDSQIL